MRKIALFFTILISVSSSIAQQTGLTQHQQDAIKNALIRIANATQKAYLIDAMVENAIYDGMTLIEVSDILNMKISDFEFYYGYHHAWESKVGNGLILWDNYINDPKKCKVIGFLKPDDNESIYHNKLK